MARAERLDRILEAGARVLAERGWFGTTMRDVAEEAGVGVATVYHYVAGREDLLYQVERRILEAAVASARAALATRGSRERLRALLTDHIRRILARPAEVDVLSGAWPRLRGDRGRRVQELRDDYIALVRATAEGALRRGGSGGREAEARTWMLLGMADRLALEAVAGRQPGRPSVLAGRVLTVFLEGARRRKS